jgi:hypothetical protein
LAGLAGVSGIVWFVFRVVTRQFDQRTVLIALLVSTAILIVGTLAILAGRRRRFAMLSVEDRRLLETHGGGLLLGGGSTSSRLAAVGSVILVLSGAAALFAVGTKPSLQMSVGDCLTLDRQTSIQSVSAIPCALPRGEEIYAIVTDPAPPGAPYPGIEAVRAAAKPGCEAAYKVFIGEPYTTSSTLWISILSPEEPYWVLDIRQNWCAVSDPSGQQMTGSARGSHR